MCDSVGSGRSRSRDKRTSTTSSSTEVLCANGARSPRSHTATSSDTLRSASQAAKDQPTYDMKRVSTALDGLLECPDNQRIAVEGGLQRVASVVVMQELFSMAWAQRALGHTLRSTSLLSDEILGARALPQQCVIRVLLRTADGVAVTGHPVRGKPGPHLPTDRVRT